MTDQDINGGTPAGTGETNEEQTPISSEETGSQSGAADTVADDSTSESKAEPEVPSSNEAVEASAPAPTDTVETPAADSTAASSSADSTGSAEEQVDTKTAAPAAEEPVSTPATESPEVATPTETPIPAPVVADISAAESAPAPVAAASNVGDPAADAVPAPESVPVVDATAAGTAAATAAAGAVTGPAAGSETEAATAAPGPTAEELAAVAAAEAEAKAAAEAAAKAELERIRPIWEDLLAKHTSREPFDAVVTAVNRGGVVAEHQGVEIFVPQSHWSNKRGEQADSSVVGQSFPMNVLEITKFETDARRVTGSRRSILRKAFDAGLEPGARLTGRVSSLPDFGAFVDIGGVDGRLHVSQISHARGMVPRDLLKKGEEIEVIVKKIEKGGKRISLGRKELLDSPWKGVAAKYEIESVRVGTVVSVTDIGAFVQLEPGVDGLLRPREISWTKRIGTVAEVLSVGQSVKVMVTSVNEEDQRIGLSVRRTEENPWPGIVERFADEEQTYEGTVKEISAKGAVVAVDEIEGFLPRGRMGRDANKLTEMSAGDKLTVNVIEVDPKRPSVIFAIPGAGGGRDNRGGGGGGRSFSDGQSGERGRGRGRGRDRNFQASPAVPSNEIKSSETVSNFSLGAMLADAMKEKLGVEEEEAAAAQQKEAATPVTPATETPAAPAAETSSAPVDDSEPTVSAVEPVDTSASSEAAPEATGTDEVSKDQPDAPTEDAQS